MNAPLNLAPGSIVVVRDEEWLVTQVRITDDGQLLTVQGLGDLAQTAGRWNDMVLVGEYLKTLD